MLSYSIQTDADGEVTSIKGNMVKALEKAQSLSKELQCVVYVAAINGGDVGDTDVASYNNGIKL